MTRNEQPRTCTVCEHEFRPEVGAYFEGEPAHYGCALMGKLGRLRRRLSGGGSR